MSSKLLAITAVVALATAAVTSVQASPFVTAPKGVGMIMGGQGHAPGEPAWVKVQENRDLRQYLGRRHLASAAYRCNPAAFWQAYNYTNKFHELLWSYYEQVYYCTALGYVTYFYRFRWHRMGTVVPVFKWSGWSWDGDVDIDFGCANEHCWEPGIATSRTAITEGAFHICYTPFGDLCNHLYPIVKITVYGDGHAEGAKTTA